MQTIYLIIALIVAFLWGIEPIIHKHLLKRNHAITIMFVSSITYIILLTCYAYTHRHHIYSDLNSITALDLVLLGATASIISLIAHLLYYHVLQKHDSSIVSALVCSSPIFTLLIAYLLLEERINLTGILGIFSITFGVILISFNSASINIFEFSLLNRFQK
jgi:uncharacterized membrane protein